MSNKATYSNGETPSVCIVGAGFSGLCTAIQLKKQLGLNSFTIFDTNKDVGGTWLMNAYPGCACDVASHAYSLSFELNPDWSEHYPSQPEIWNYMKNVTKKYELYPHMKFNTEVKTMTWEESMKKWRVLTYNKKTATTSEQFFDITIQGTGPLRSPYIPEEFKSFKGPLLHPAKWDPKVELKNKVVGVVGNGSTAVQLIPAIAKDVKELHCYQRKQSWIIPRIQGRYPQFVKSMFSIFPLLMKMFRLLIFMLHESLFPMFEYNTRMNRLGNKLSFWHMERQIPGEVELQKKLTPKFAFGCKRLLFQSDYFPTLALPNVNLRTDKIVEVTSSGIRTEDGDFQNLDVLIVATGYEVHDYFGPMKIYGINSENVLQTWKDKIPLNYYGIVSHSMPNHFILLGPNTALGHNTVVFMIECQVTFTINAIREMMKRNARVVAVKQSAQDNFMSWLAKEMKKTVWGNEKCGSWYANKDGVITALWPQSCISYWRKTRKTDFSHFDFY